MEEEGLAKSVERKQKLLVSGVQQYIHGIERVRKRPILHLIRNKTGSCVGSRSLGTRDFAEKRGKREK